MIRPASIKIADVAFGRVYVPDLDVAEEFLTDFGLLRAERTPTTLYMRGTGAGRHLYVAEKGGTGFIGFAYRANSEEELECLAQLPGATGIETLDEPGGGKRVRLTEPNGYQIEVIYGQTQLEPIPRHRQQTNTTQMPLRRAGELWRQTDPVPKVARLGHTVIASPDVQRTVRWFRETLGLVASDDMYLASPDNVLGSFNRVDRGAEYVDHHVFFCVIGERAGLNHFGFEVDEIEDVFIGHAHLHRLGKYEHMWGVGRHLLGSQVFDYWADPWGRMHEHWADTDRLNLASGSHLITWEEGNQSQWGDAPPLKFIKRVSP